MKWLLAKVRYERPADDGSCKKVTEQYVVDAMSFAEAETRITQSLQPYVKGEFEVTGINPKNYAEVHFSNFGDADKWYECTLEYITLDEKTANEKRTKQKMLIQAKSLRGAINAIDEIMGKTMIDYDNVDVKETAIMDVFKYEPKKEAVDGNND